ncbi:MAG: site-specific DNA-methyltransferase [Runella sp.]
MNEPTFELHWEGKNAAKNETLLPPLGHLVGEDNSPKTIDCQSHIFIEGENLQVLRCLQATHAGRIKMVYIDPPYNTGSRDFVYADNFSQNGGHGHSVWLSMMYPRLKLAWQLLRPDGVIFVSIDENEYAHLKLLMNEIFGEQNYRNTFIARRHDKNLNRQFMDKGLRSFNVGFEYILCYAKSDAFLFRPVYRTASATRQNTGYWKGFWNDADRPTMRYDILGYTPPTGQWKWSKEKGLEAVANYQLYLEKFANQLTLEEYWEQTGRQLLFIRRNPNGKGKNRGVENWIPPSEGVLRTTNWTDLLISKAEKEGEDLFDFPKNIEVIKGLIQAAGCQAGDIVMDFFAGSGSSAQAVLELNETDHIERRFLLVQVAEPCPEGSAAKAAGYETIADLTRQRIKKVIAKLKPRTKVNYLRYMAQ